jgi:Tfp pilus assembly protein PilO
MKLPKNYFSNLSASRYKEYLKLLPNMQQENTRIVTTLIFTFFALSFFGIFAIKPTLTTIVELRKKLADSQLVFEKLQTKITNLSSLQTQYNALSSEIPFILEAIPQNPKATELVAQVIGLSKQKGVTILSLETSGITLIERSKPADPVSTGSALPADPINVSMVEPDTEDEADSNSFTFSLQAQGPYETLLDYATTLSGIQRIIKVESMSINTSEKGGNLVLSLKGRAYFKN